MESETYYIPANYTDVGKLFGLFEIRNAIEAVLVGLPTLAFCTFCLPLELTWKIIELLPVNFYTMSELEKGSAIADLAVYLKIAPSNLQINVLTRKFDLNSYRKMLRGRWSGSGTIGAGR